LRQEISSHDKLAVVENPEQKKTLVFERRTLLIDSIIGTIENLGVHCDLVVEEDQFLKMMRTGTYAYVMGSLELLSRNKDAIQESGENFQVIALVEFSEAIGESWRTLSMPVNVISVANAYNGVPDRLSHDIENELSVKFSAPDARVLVVDDINTNLKVAKGLLMPYDLQIDLCNGGEEAIEAVKNTKYDLVFMDHRMPGIDGIEATEIIRSLSSGDSYFKDLPIVALTANAVANMREMFLEAGFNDFMSKPIDTIVLNTVLHRWIDKSKQRRYVEKETPDTGVQEEDYSIAIDGVKVDKGIRMSGGTREMYLETLSTFYDDGNERINMIRESLDTDNLPLYMTYVHALKSALLNIGADELAETAIALESAAQRRNIAYIESINDQFLAVLQRVLRDIGTVLVRSSKAPIGASVSSDESEKEMQQFKSMLAELRKALDDMDAGTMNRTLDELLKATQGKEVLSDIRKISKHILMVEYDEAEELIDTLLGE
jgi:CheY-like chemotaxis protein